MLTAILKRVFGEQANRPPVKHDYTSGTWNWGHDVKMERTDIVGEYSIIGWSAQRIAAGDLIRRNTKSGRIGLFKVTEIRFYDNPPDMFEGKAVAVGYDD